MKKIISFIYDFIIIVIIIAVGTIVTALFGTIPYLIFYFTSMRLTTHQLYLSVGCFSTIGLIGGCMISYRYIQSRISQ